MSIAVRRKSRRLLRILLVVLLKVWLLLLVLRLLRLIVSAYRLARRCGRCITKLAGRTRFNQIFEGRERQRLRRVGVQRARAAAAATAERLFGRSFWRGQLAHVLLLPTDDGRATRSGRSASGILLLLLRGV